MATEHFEGGTAGAEILSSNSIFNPLFGAPEFTASPVHAGSLAATGGGGFFFDPGSSSMVYYLADAPSAEVWAFCDNGIGAGQKNVLQEMFDDVAGTFGGSMYAGIEYVAASDKLKAFYFDAGFGFQEVDLVSSVSTLGWLRLQSWATSTTTRNYKVYDAGGTLLADYNATIYDPANFTPDYFTTGYSLGVMSSANGAAFDVTVDDFMCPIEEAAPGKPIRRVYPRGNPSRIYPPDRSQQRTNRAGGGTFF